MQSCNIVARPLLFRLDSAGWLSRVMGGGAGLRGATFPRYSWLTFSDARINPVDIMQAAYLISLGQHKIIDNMCCDVM